MILKSRSQIESRRSRKRNNSDKGAGFVEYGAIILLVAAIATAVLTLDLGNTISTWITDAFGKITEKTEITNAKPGEGGGDGGDGGGGGGD